MISITLRGNLLGIIFWDEEAKAVKVLPDDNDVENRIFHVILNISEFPQGCFSSKTDLSLLCVITNYANTVI